MTLNPRLADFVALKGDYYIWSAPNRKVRLPDVETANRILARIDAARRSPADYQLLALGITNRFDDRTLGQKLSEIPTWGREDYHSSTGNQARDSFNEIRGIFAPKKSALEQALADFAREADEFDEAQEAPPTKEPNPKRLAQAAEHYLVSLYTAPLTAFRQTEAMLDAAEANDGKAYSAIHREWAAAEEVRIAAADAELAAEQARIAADRKSLGDADFEFDSPATSPSNTTSEETTNDSV